MAALSQIVENTKRPVVFTSNTSILPDLSVNLPMARVRFDAPSVQECTAYGALASARACTLRPSDVAAVSLACKGDLRRTLHNAQLASCTDGIVTTDSIDQDRHPTVLVDAARSLVSTGVARWGATPVGAAKALHASLVEQQREEFERTIKCVREGLVRHRTREARWAEIKEAKRAERLQAKKKLLGYDADKAPLDLKDSTVKRATEDVDEETKEQEFEERAHVALSAFEPRPPVPEPDWDHFDAHRQPAGGRRARRARRASVARPLNVRRGHSSFIRVRRRDRAVSKGRTLEQRDDRRRARGGRLLAAEDFISATGRRVKRSAALITSACSRLTTW